MAQAKEGRQQAIACVWPVSQWVALRGPE